MDHIYETSHLTIYAKVPTSCEDGFLGHQRRGDGEWKWLAPVPAPNGMESFFRCYHPDGFYFPTDRFTGPSALDRRGWCLQEEVLPRRQLLLLCYRNGFPVSLPLSL